MNKITRRWFVDNFVIILVILIIIEFIITLGIKNFYYNSVDKFIRSQSIAIIKLIEKSYENNADNFDFEIRSLMENFQQRDKIEIIIFDNKNDVYLTSSGFNPKETIYKQNNNMYRWIRENIIVKKPTEAICILNGENIMSLTYQINNGNENINYIKFISSITRVDRQIIFIIIITGLIGVIMIFLVVISSSYFIQSIVVPVDEISKTAKKIAQGDFNIRLEKNTDDEIGDLCETINNMAEELSISEKLKNEFISSISHELKTPLTAIKGWAETLNDSHKNEKELLKKGMKVIIGETERLSKMVEDLLDFSRLESGNLKLVLEKLDLITELENILIIFEERSKQERIKINFKFPNECVMIMADKSRLKQVFTNIIDNSLKYSDRGKEIYVIIEKKIDYSLIKIIDNGCGIKLKDLPNVKNKFYKANYSRRGAGIGLAIADEIIRLHNGSLDVYSVEGEGTTVNIKIPLYK